MSKSISNPLSRRNFIRASVASTAGISILPLYLYNTKSSLNSVMAVGQLPSIIKRKFGNFNFEVTTMGLGGQAAIQWTPSNVDPAAIIVKAVKLGINYFDTSNVYGNSQINYNKAFKLLSLIPGTPNYDANLRKSIWLTSKTHMRWGKPGYPERPNITNSSNGTPGVKCAVDDLKRSLTQIFGDNKGAYPGGAYLDMILIHSVNSTDTNDVLFEGLETPLDPNGNFGALVALRDFRDGTNLTGMNPKNEKLVRHIGFSGHSSPPVMIDLIQRDEFGILEAMLVAINSNDKTRYCMQHNVIPVAEAKGMGIIGMKVFADAALYHKTPNWSGSSADLFQQIGTSELPSRPLIEYTLTTPGVHTAIMGIGHIDEDPLKCQLIQNLNAAQIDKNGISETERKRIEELTKTLKPNSNYFQLPKVGLTKPRNLRNEGNIIIWDNAFAGDAPLKAYEILVNGVKAGEVEHQPQTLKSMPFTFEILAISGDKVEISAVDQNGNRAVGFLVLAVSAPVISKDKKKVQLYPNPVQTELAVRYIATANSRVSIYNTVGEKLIEKTANGTQAKFDVSNLRKGIYFVRFTDGSSEKFIKQ
ncbi:MAG: aldo/keto reductase [Bacteroidota bacterium]|nr:aldo/keto reductase [Bacteroidota bacterium]